VASDGVLANDTDADSDLLTAVLVSGPSHGTLTFSSDGGFDYTPTTSYIGTDSFQYQASDGVLTSSTVTVTLDVANTPPTAADQAYRVLHDTTLSAPASSLMLGSSDADNDALTAALATQAGHGTATVSANGSFTYAANTGYTGTDSFTYLLSDGIDSSAAATVTLTVKATNTAPTATADAYGTPHDQALTVDAVSGVLANDSDADGDPLQALLVSGPAHGTLALGPDGSFTYTADTGYAGTDSFSYQAGDGTTTSSAVTVSLTVSNDTPTAADDFYSIPGSGTTSVDAWSGVLANDGDAEGDTLTASLVTGPAHGTLTLNSDGSFDYTPGSGFSGTDTFSYEAFDGNSHSTAATVTLTVAPVALDASFSVLHDQTLQENVVTLLTFAADADNDALTAQLVSGAAHGSVTVSSDGSFVYTPNAGYVGSDSFTYRVGDGSTYSNTATASIEVTDSAPMAGSQTFSDHAGGLRTVGGAGLLADAGDDDDEALSVVLVTGPAHGTLNLNPAGTFTYQPVAGFVGTDTFTYRAFDGAEYSDAATVTLTVFDAAPVATADAYFVPTSGLSVGSAAGVLANDYDPDGDALSVTLVSGPGHAASGGFTLNANGSFSYTPASGFTGTDSFTYQTSDGTLTDDPVTVTLTVTATPVAAPDYYDLPASGTLSVAAAQGLLANDFDPTATALQAVLVSGPSSGMLTLNTDGSFTYTPSGTPTTVTFQYEARVGSSGALSSPVTVTLLASGDRPTVTLEQVTFLNGHALIPDDGVIPADEHPTWRAGQSLGDPMAYTQGAVMHVQAVFSVSDTSQFQGGVQVIGTGDGLTVSGLAYLDGSGRLVLADAEVQLIDEITYYKPLTLSWQVLPNGAAAGAGLQAGTSQDALYQVGAVLAPWEKPWQTVVDLATKAAKGAVTDDDKVKGVWNLFKVPDGKKIPQVERSSDQRVLTYYGDWLINDAAELAWQNSGGIMPAPGTTSSLLMFGDGNCQAWAFFFLDVLYKTGVRPVEPFVGILPVVQGEWLFVKNWTLSLNPVGNHTGIAENRYLYFNGTPQNGKKFYFKRSDKEAAVPNVVVYEYTFEPSDVKKINGVAGQGNPNPLSMFRDHALATAVVNKKEVFYDPSYGLSYSSINSLDDDGMDYYGGPVFQSYRWIIRENKPAAQGGVDLRRDPNHKNYPGEE
jgi:VCBS repeat-containing protein